MTDAFVGKHWARLHPDALRRASSITNIPSM
jgi:hypothetical protein